MTATDENPIYVAIIISPPFTLLRICPYIHPNKIAKGIDIIIAPANPTNPLSPISILITAPKSPASTPKGIPKFNPVPDCIIGTRDKTSIAFIPNLTNVSPKADFKFIPIKGETICKTAV